MARRGAKSPDAYRTISEAADALDLPQHVLRFWETRFSQIKPMKRSGGRRYYRPSDLALLRGIKHLLYAEGYTIKGVQRILREQGIAHVVATPGEQELGPAHQHGLNGDAGHQDTRMEPTATAGTVATSTMTAKAMPTSAMPTPDLLSEIQPHGHDHAHDPVRQALAGGLLAPHQPVEPAVAEPPVATTHHNAVASPAASVSPPPPPASPTLRFVSEQNVPAQPLPANSVPQQQPLPPPLADTVLPVGAMVPSNGQSRPTASLGPTSVGVPQAGLAHTAPFSSTGQVAAVASRPPGADLAAIRLSGQQTEALVSALRTLMECKSQLDQARPTTTAPFAGYTTTLSNNR